VPERSGAGIIPGAHATLHRKIPVRGTHPRWSPCSSGPGRPRSWREARRCSIGAAIACHGAETADLDRDREIVREAARRLRSHLPRCGVDQPVSFAA